MNSKNKSAPKGAGNGDGNGEDNGPQPAIDFDLWLDKVRPELGALHENGFVAGTDGDGRTIGSKLGKIVLEPLETLEDRIEEDWPGPRNVVIRVKHRQTGHWVKGLVGLLHVPAPKAGRSNTPSTNPALDALIETNKKQAAQIDELMKAIQAGQARPPPPTVTEQTSAFDSLINAVTRLLPQNAAPAAAPGMTFEQWKAVYDEGKRDGRAQSGDKSTGALAIEALKDGINDVTRAVGATLAAKATNIGAAGDEREAAALERTLAAKRALKEEGFLDKDDE